MDVNKYWEATVKQDADTMRDFFDTKALVKWHNTNEQFTLEEYIQANCEYPGNWEGEVEKIVNIHDLIITVTKVYCLHPALSFHVTSFIKMNEEDKILCIDEYWGDDGKAPQWRLDKHLGIPIHAIVE